MAQQLIELMQQAETLSAKDQLALIAHLAQKTRVALEQTELTDSSKSKAPNISTKGKSIREILNDFSTGLSDESMAQLPTDGAEQHDHYIYGTPKVRQ